MISLPFPRCEAPPLIDDSGYTYNQLVNHKFGGKDFTSSGDPDGLGGWACPVITEQQSRQTTVRGDQRISDGEELGVC